MIDYKSSSLGTIESSLVNYALTTRFVEDSKVATVSTKVTCIKPFLFNIILILLFLGDMILRWIQKKLLDLPFCSNCNCIFLHSTYAYDPIVNFHTFRSLYSPHLCSHHFSTLYHYVIVT